MHRVITTNYKSRCLESEFLSGMVAIAASASPGWEQTGCRPLRPPVAREHTARRKEHLLLRAKLGKHRDIRARVVGRVALLCRLELPQHVGAIVAHVAHRRVAGAARGHECRIVVHPEAARKLAAHAAVQRPAHLLRRRHGGQLADGAHEQPDGGRESLARVACHRAAGLTRQQADAAQKLVDRLVRRAAVKVTLSTSSGVKNAWSSDSFGSRPSLRAACRLDRTKSSAFATK
eukprot:scaffold176059_cov28-Tisochrysis_lutea.AAC.1